MAPQERSGMTPGQPHPREVWWCDTAECDGPAIEDPEEPGTCDECAQTLRRVEVVPAEQLRDHRAHWLVHAKHSGPIPTWDAGQAERYRANGYRVEGPFVRAGELQGAVDALREAHAALRAGIAAALDHLGEP